MKNKPWLKSYDSEVPHSLSYENGLIPSLLEKTARKYPHRNALMFFGFTMTYQQLWDAVEQCTRALHDIGVRAKERTVLFLPNCPHFIIAYFAVLRLGGVVVPTNPLYSEKELEFQINDCAAETAVTLDLLFAQVRKLRPGTRLKRIIVGKIQDYLPPLKKFIYPIMAQKGTDNVVIEEKNGIYIFQKLLGQKLPAFDVPSIQSDDIAVLQYTGGTTGVSKGAMLSHRNIVSNNLQTRRWYFDIREGKETFIAVLPFFHTYGSAIAMNLPISVAATIIIFPKFSAKDVLKAINNYSATVLPGIPSIYSVLNSYKDIKKYDMSSVKYCISGAAPLPESVLKDFEETTGGKIIEGYGLSEASPVTHANCMLGRRKFGSIGPPLPDTDCKIVDPETGENLPADQQGELCIKGPQIMKGYWNKDEETRRTLRDEWLFTGDIARMDRDGYFYIVERKKDMIISEGFNIYPREVEEFLLKHPGIADAAVVGTPDKLRGERVLAYVVLKGGRTVTPEDIIKYCKDNLIKYKVPKKVFLKDRIPTNIAGKKLRRILREDAEKRSE